MVKDKLKRLDIKYFLIPFAVLLFLFALLTTFVIRDRVREKYREFEDAAISIVDGYSSMLSYSHEAYETISQLLDEKLRVALQALALIEGKADGRFLEDLATRFSLDDIYLYDKEGVILFSTGNKYIGWTAYEGHPVHAFMTSGEQMLIEDIRQDTESGISYKFAYIRNEDGSFIQIGALADQITDFRGRFELEQMIGNLSFRSDIEHVSFIDPMLRVVASSEPGFLGMTIRNEYIKEQIADHEFHVVRMALRG